MSGFVSSYVMMERMQYRIDDFDMSAFYTLCPSLFVYEIRVSMQVIFLFSFIVLIYYPIFDTLCYVPLYSLCDMYLSVRC